MTMVGEFVSEKGLRLKLPAALCPEEPIKGSLSPGVFGALAYEEVSRSHSQGMEMDIYNNRS